MNKINAVYVSLVALVVAVAALVLCFLGCNKGGEAVNVEQVLKDKPEIVVEAMQNYENKQREEAQKVAELLLVANKDALANNPADGFLGNPEGKVVLVEFFDFSCGYCHRVYPVLKNLLTKNPELKIVAKPMAFLSPMSHYAAKAALAAKNQGKFAEIYSAVFEFEGNMTEADVDAAAAAAGLDMVKFKADLESEEVSKALGEVSELANKIQVQGVPAMIVNGKFVQSLDENIIQEAIDAAK